MSILKRIIEDRKLLIPESGKYMVIGSFAGTTMEAKGMVSPMFRPFETVKESSHRNTNASSTFDMYTDSLMDYPTIIRYKLSEEKWEPYNKLISVHIPLCPFDCWHCYNDKGLYFSRREQKNWEKLSSYDIVDAFFKQHIQDSEEQNNNMLGESNVLRITGGEPFLVPELILECLEQLKSRRRNFNRKPFLWTETNLWPFITENGENFPELLKILPELTKYRNLAVHPCIHGITDDELASNTNQPDIKLEGLLEGIKILLVHKIDIYPTFGSNVNPPEAIEQFFKKIYDINKLLPLRIALVRYDLHYPEVEDRLEKDDTRNPKLYSGYTSLRIWNTLLTRHYGVGYGVIPRHLVPLYGKQTLVKPAPNFIADEHNEYKPSHELDQADLLYIFKSSYEDDYHRELLDILSLPKGHIYKLEYNTKWMQDDLWQHMKMRPGSYDDKQAILIYADDRSRHEKFLPLREVKVKQVEVQGRVAVFHLELGDFLFYREGKLPSGKTLQDELNKFKNELEDLFGKSTLPGTALNKFILLGEKVATLGMFEKGDEVSHWRSTIEFLHNMQCQAFKESLFFYIPKDKMEGLTQKSTEKSEIVYSCPSGEPFSFRVYYSLPNYHVFSSDTERRTIHFETSNEVIKTLVSNNFVLSKYGSEHLKFMSELLINSKKECSIFFKSPKNPFNAPAPQLTIEVKDIRRKATHTHALGSAIAGLAGAVIGLMGGAILTIKEGTAGLSQGHIIMILIGAFVLFYLSDWLLHSKGTS